ncbi:hypothetical protein BUE80_DR012392 [Diplocarpon rosae]|nr:hypothetical protein BUE80_DR012392 [Diplocarpon rosae]
MNTQDPRGEKTPLGKGTGFPEPLSADRNTTLPHPDADTSPNATIEAREGDFIKAHSRRSFLALKHRSRNSSFTHIDLVKSGLGLYDNIEYADDNKEEKGLKEFHPDLKGGDGPKPSSSQGSSSLDGSLDMEIKNGRRKRRLMRMFGFS